MSNLVTLKQALLLRDLGFNEVSMQYAYRFFKNGDFHIQNGQTFCKNSDSPLHILVLPTIDQAIDWIRRKYNIIIYNAMEPFVDPITNKILYRYKVKKCNVKWGWNQREPLGQSRMSPNVYAMKRQALTIAIRYILKKNADSRRCSKHRKS